MHPFSKLGRETLTQTEQFTFDFPVALSLYSTPITSPLLFSKRKLTVPSTRLTLLHFTDLDLKNIAYVLDFYTFLVVLLAFLAP